LHDVASGPGSFKDHFSGNSAHYARHRPQYPAELYQFLADQTDNHGRAWDCATGNGQAAIALSKYFESVVATDASSAQIDAAIAHPGVTYRVAAAEDSQLDADSIDLITVGQALHWFDHERFFTEARRVLRKDGVLAAWCYELCSVSEACDAAVDKLYREIVGDFWPPERRLIEVGYADIAMPGRSLESPEFQMRVSWTVADMLGYLRTWSGCARYRQAHGDDPVLQIEAALRDAWGAGPRTVQWPLTLLVSRL
jgi:SAM-dependent methyltransferase